MPVIPDELRAAKPVLPGWHLCPAFDEVSSGSLSPLPPHGGCFSAQMHYGRDAPAPSLGARLYAANRSSRTSSKICLKAGSGARHIVRYVSRKGSQTNQMLMLRASYLNFCLGTPLAR